MLTDRHPYLTAREVVLERWLPKLVEEVAHGNAG